jgi:hypothetical protein
LFIGQRHKKTYRRDKDWRRRRRRRRVAAVGMKRGGG